MASIRKARALTLVASVPFAAALFLAGAGSASAAEPAPMNSSFGNAVAGHQCDDHGCDQGRWDDHGHGHGEDCDHGCGRGDDDHHGRGDDCDQHGRWDDDHHGRGDDDHHHHEGCHGLLGLCL